MTETKTDNELIAEFDGKYTTDSSEWCTTNKRLVDVYRYDTSWDWLMPVVHSITNTKTMNQAWYDVKYRLMDADITAVYKAVVRFIKWYNEQKQ